MWMCASHLSSGTTTNMNKRVKISIHTYISKILHLVHAFESDKYNYYTIFNLIEFPQSNSTFRQQYSDHVINIYSKTPLYIQFTRKMRRLKNKIRNILFEICIHAKLKICKTKPKDFMVHSYIPKSNVHRFKIILIIFISI